MSGFLMINLLYFLLQLSHLNCNRKKRKKRRDARLSHFWEGADIVAPMSHYLKIVTPFKLSNKIFLWVEAKHGNSEPRRPTFILPQELSSCTWGFRWKVSGHGHERSLLLRCAGTRFPHFTWGSSPVGATQLVPSTPSC